MAGGSVTASARFVGRNNIGEFIRECELAATATIEEIVTEGAIISRQLAPRRTGALVASIEGAVLSRTSGQWIADTPYALAQELGASPHKITGNPHLAFYWEKAGRWFVPSEVFYNLPMAITEVNHPGNPAVHYLLQAYEAMTGRVMGIAQRHYP